MWNLKILLLSLILCCSLSAQNDYNCNTLISYKYGSDGRITEDYKTENIFGSLRSKYFYDDTLLVNIKSYSESSLLISETIYEYSAGHLLVKSTEKKYYDYPSIVEGKHVFEYTPTNLEDIKTIEYDAAGKQVREFSVSNPGGEQYWEKITKYKNNLPEVEICNPSDTSGRKYEIHYSYYSSGKLKKDLYIYPDTSINSEKVYTYDASGRLVKTELYYENKLQVFEKYVYNSSGLLIDIDTYQAAEGETKDRIIAKNHYDYDSNGRLIKECFAQYTQISTGK